MSVVSLPWSTSSDFVPFGDFVRFGIVPPLDRFRKFAFDFRPLTPKAYAPARSRG